MTRAKLIKEIERHKVAIGKHRDDLRSLLEEAEQVASDADEAIECLEIAVDRLSELC